MNNLQKLSSPLVIIVVAVLVVLGLVGYNEWSIRHRQQQLASAYESVSMPDYSKLTLKKYEDVNKSAKSKATVSAWVYRYTVMVNSAGVETAKVHHDAAADLQKAGFVIDSNPAGADDQQKVMQIYAHKNNVDLQVNFDKPDVTTSMVAIVYEK